MNISVPREVVQILLNIISRCRLKVMIKFGCFQAEIEKNKWRVDRVPGVIVKVRFKVVLNPVYFECTILRFVKVRHHLVSE